MAVPCICQCLLFLSIPSSHRLPCQRRVLLMPQGSAALVEAVTNVRVEVKLGLLSPDAQHVLMLYMTHQEPSGT